MRKGTGGNMRKFRQISGVLVAVGIILLGLLAFFFIDIREQERVGRSMEETVNSGRPVRLVYYTWDDEESYMRPMTDSFNAINPNIQVELHVLDSTDFDNIIMDMLQSGEQVDIIGVRGFSQMTRYQVAGMLEDITADILESDIDITVYGNMYNNIMIDGKYYGMPTRSTCWVLVYNKDIFDKQGVPYPGQITWEEYGELAKRLKTVNDAGETVWGGYIPSWALNFAGIQNSNYLYDDDQTYQRESLALLNQFMNIDKSHMGMLEIEENEDKDITYLELFEEGKVGIMPMGEWFVGMIMADEHKGISDVNWDLAPMPIFPDMNPGTTWGQYQFTGMTSLCKEKDAAFEFLKYVGGEEGARIYAEYGMLSAYSSAEIRKIYQDAVGDKNVGVFFDAFRIQEIPVFDHYEEINHVFTDLGKAYLKGERTLDETMEEFERERTKVMEDSP